MHSVAPVPLTCGVVRDECAAEDLIQSGSECRSRETSPFDATICANPDNIKTDEGRMAACMDAFCNKDNANPRAQYTDEPCSITKAEVPDKTLLPTAGACQPAPAGSGRASVDYRLRSRPCVLGEGGNCDTLVETVVLSPVPPGNCFDLSKDGAFQKIQPSDSDRDRSTQLFRVILDDSRCLLSNSLVTTYVPVAGPLGSGQGAGLNVPFATTGGFISFTKPCPTCALDRLDQMRVNVGDLTVAGSRLTNVVVSTAMSAPLKGTDPSDPTKIGVGPHDLRLVVTGLENGSPAIYRLENQAAWPVLFSPTAVRLFGPLTVVDVDANGDALLVVVNANVSGTPATPQVAACATLSPRDRLFGFEDPESWSSTNATLSQITSPVTQGCGALGISGQGYMPIAGAPFSAAGMTVNSAMSVDLFVPDNQPNRFWLGALQMYLSCPSAGSFNQYVGQVELTGKPQNQFSTLRFPLPAPLASLLRQGQPNCSFSFALNVNQTGRTWILDNLRSTP